MKIFNHKKSQGVLSNWPFWICFIIAVGIVSLVIVAIANVNVRKLSKIPEDVEDEISLMPRFYSSENCFAYEDDLGRVHMRVIDITKFEQVRMIRCFPRSSVDYAFSLALDVPQHTESNRGPITTFNWEGSSAGKEVREDVLVLQKGVRYEGELIIRIKNVR
jgi:hypothetical protein